MDELIAIYLGEMIRQNFGDLEIAQRSLDIYTAALLREAFIKRVEPKQEWRDEMERVSEVSCNSYRHTVREDPRFVPYFRQATPELELGKLNIGSRPAKRNPKGGVESLRAIPWYVLFFVNHVAQLRENNFY